MSSVNHPAQECPLCGPAPEYLTLFGRLSLQPLCYRGLQPLQLVLWEAHVHVCCAELYAQEDYEYCTLWANP